MTTANDPSEIARDKHGYRLCTPARPWTPADGLPVVHEGATSDGDSDYVDYYRCKDCGHRWGVEVPE